MKKRLNLGVNAFLGKFEALLGYFVTKYSFELRPSVRPSTEPWESSSLSVECLLHLPARPCLVWGDLRGEIANPNFEHESASRGKAPWILSLFLMIMVQSVWPEWWKCQPAYLSGTAWRCGGRHVRKTTRTCFEIRRVLLASHSGICALLCVWLCAYAAGWGKSDKSMLQYGWVCWYLHECTLREQEYGMQEMDLWCLCPLLSLTSLAAWDRWAYASQNTGRRARIFLILTTADREITFSIRGPSKLMHMSTWAHQLNKDIRFTHLTCFQCHVLYCRLFCELKTCVHRKSFFLKALPPPVRTCA